MRWPRTTFIGLLALLLCCAGCEQGVPPTKGADELSACADIYSAFFKDNPECSPITAAEADINDDGAEDLVLLYVDPQKNNQMRVLLRSANQGYTALNEHRAPVSNQSIIFRNIDNKPPLEFIVQGMKGAKSGFAIYRMEGGEIVDIFGEGMEDCC